MQINGSTSNAHSSENRDVYIVSACRTPIGSLGGSLSKLKAPALASKAIKSALDRIGLAPEHIEKVTIGQAVQGGSGQAPAKQALMGAGLPSTCRDALINEVCASGMESMSNVPYYSPRVVPLFGGFSSEDGLTVDGLSDTFNKCQMGDCAEKTAKKLGITRKDQDDYAIESYRRARAATEAGVLMKEICPVEVPGRRGQPPVIVTEDEEFKNINVEKVPTLTPYFDRQSGTITAANASTLADGAAACVLMSSKALEKHQVAPLAKIVAFGEGACDPIDFSTSPIDAVKDVLKKAQLSIDDISLWEINEAFSVVALANMKVLGLDKSKVNINGGGVSIGHPLGMSGTRIVNSLVHQLKEGQFGCAAICRGGGGSSAMIVQKL